MSSLGPSSTPHPSTCGRPAASSQVTCWGLQRHSLPFEGTDRVQGAPPGGGWKVQRVPWERGFFSCRLLSPQSWPMPAGLSFPATTLTTSSKGSSDILASAIPPALRVGRMGSRGPQNAGTEGGCGLGQDQGVLRASPEGQGWWTRWWSQGRGRTAPLASRAPSRRELQAWDEGAARCRMRAGEACCFFRDPGHQGIGQGC